jgi:hypothetical protein
VGTPHANADSAPGAGEIGRQPEDANAAANGSPRIRRGCELHVTYDAIQDELAIPAGAPSGIACRSRSAWPATPASRGRPSRCGRGVGGEVGAAAGSVCGPSGAGVWDGVGCGSTGWALRGNLTGVVGGHKAA